MSGGLCFAWDHQITQNKLSASEGWGFVCSYVDPTAQDWTWHIVSTEQKRHLLTHQSPPGCWGIEIRNRQTQCLLAPQPLAKVISPEKAWLRMMLVRKDMNTGSPKGSNNPYYSPTPPYPEMTLLLPTLPRWDLQPLGSDSVVRCQRHEVDPFSLSFQN